MWLKKGSAGAFIRHCRNGVEISQRELSESSGIARIDIAHYELGHAEPPLLKFVAIIECMGHTLSGFELWMRKRR